LVIRKRQGEYMHIVLSSHFKSFVTENGLTSIDEAKSFEAFINYCVIKQYFYGQFDILDQIYNGDDPGIDGIMFIVDGELVTSKNEIVEIFSRPKKDMDVLICITQAKTGERWEKREINAFESGIMDFLAEKSLYPQDDYLKERKDIFKEVISNIRKVKNGKPRIKCFYATSGKYIEDREIEAAFGSIKARLNETGLFYSVDAEPLERDTIIKYWVNSYSPLEAKAKIIASALFPAIPGIEESYVITMFAKEYVEKILADDNMNLRKGIFEENVRDFIGEDSPVNKEIEKTIVDTTKNKRFGIMNNGVTIVSPDIRLQSNELYLENYQIVNGCQTSNVLWENRDRISQDATITLKIVETTDESVVDDLVKSTNNQTKVDDHLILGQL